MKTLHVLGSRPATGCACLPVAIHPFFDSKNLIKKPIELLGIPDQILSQKWALITMRCGRKTCCSEGHFCLIFPAVFALFLIALF